MMAWGALHHARPVTGWHANEHRTRRYSVRAMRHTQALILMNCESSSDKTLVLVVTHWMALCIYIRRRQPGLDAVD